MCPCQQIKRVNDREPNKVSETTIMVLNTKKKRTWTEEYLPAQYSKVQVFSVFVNTNAVKQHYNNELR